MATVQSIERALTLLNVLSGAPEGIGISELAAETGLSKSTVHRLLATLVHMKYVTQDKKTERYMLGYQVLFLSRHLSADHGLITAARPHLEALSRDVNETIHLCVEDNGEVVYIDKIESSQTIRMYSQIGSRNPMYCTGVGKVLLSGMSQADYDKIVHNTVFTKRTANTILSAAELAKEMTIVRKQGYALDNIENEEGIRCIAAPIRDYEGRIIASFSISGPVHRMTMERVEDELAEKIKKTALIVSEEFGFRGFVS